MRPIFVRIVTSSQSINSKEKCKHSRGDNAMVELRLSTALTQKRNASLGKKKHKGGKTPCALTQKRNASWFLLT